MFILKEDDCMLVSISQGCNDLDHFWLEDVNAVHVTSDVVTDCGIWCVQRRVVVLESCPGSCSLPVLGIYACCIAMSASFDPLS